MLAVGGWLLLVILAALVAAWWLTRAMQTPIGRAVACGRPPPALSTGNERSRLRGTGR
jgi:hypothetical protein